MYRTIRWIAAGAVVVAACSGTGTEGDSLGPVTTASAEGAETTATTLASTTTIAETTSTAAVTTTEATSTTSTTTTTTTEPAAETNPLVVEAWWCDAFDVAAGQDAAAFAQAVADDFRHGYSDMPADTLEEGAEQAALVSCDPEYGRAVADALVR